MCRTQGLALGLATALAFEGCASRLPRKPPLPLSHTVNGIAVHADPIFTMAPGDEVVFEGMTRVTVRLENLDKRYAGARSADIAIDLPDGSRFPAMPPAVVQEQMDAQREHWTADLKEPPVERCIYHVLGGGFYDKTKPERCYATEGEPRRDGCRRSRR